MAAREADTADVVVAGAGVSGSAIAWRAAAAGLSVVLVDDAPQRAASRAAAGMLAPVTEVRYGEEPLLALTMEASRRYPAFVEALEQASGQATGYRRCGTLMVARDRDDLAALEHLRAFQERLGLQVETLRSRECRALEPALAPGIRGGVRVDGDHQIDNRALVAALQSAATRAGAQWRASRVAAVERSGARVSGVRLADGARIAARWVVVAAGCWSQAIAGIPEEAIPVRPVKGQLLQLRGPAESLLAARNLRGLEVYIVPRADGRVVVGATVEEQGFDLRVTAGAVYELLRAAYELLPGIAELELVETVTGLRPGSPDNTPMLGHTELDGLVAATGFYRNGVLLTPVTADAVVELLTERPTPELVAPFAPTRFAQQRQVAT